MKLFYSLIFTFFLFVNLASSQNQFTYYQSNLLSILDSFNNEFSNPFGGGLKFPVFASMDLNFDWKQDLIILDRVDNRLLTFINTGNDDTIRFTYQPQYESLFPILSRTIILKDYNRDGLQDIFSYSQLNNSGFEVYKNTSTNKKISFKKVTGQIEADFWGNQSPIYINSIDIPAFEDVDRDGDLDLVTFFILGDFLDLYENVSMQKYGIPDSLEFIYADKCWGKIQESDTSNDIILNLSCEPVKFNERTTRHAGSTLLLMDIDADSDFDLLLGDVQNPGIIQLTNGKHDYNYPLDTMVKQTKNFPKNHPVFIRNMPGLFSVDINNDGIKDLIASALDEEIIDTFQSLNQIWLYKNTGFNNKPNFEFVEDNFLQSEMLDFGGATTPVLFDYDSDGDEDILIATFGSYDQTFYQADRIFVLENQSTKDHKQYKLVNNDYLNISSFGLSGLSPCFMDFDDDGDKDLVFGQKSGRIGWFENVALLNQKPDFQFVTKFVDSIDVGDYSTPLLFDVNKDGFEDLIIGESRGNLNYYRNKGISGDLKFEFVTDTFGGIYFPLSYRETIQPTLCDLNKNGIEDLLIGGRSGFLYYYPDFESQLSQKFKKVELVIYDSVNQKSVDIPIGSLLRPIVSNFDNDTIPDIIIGSSRGGLLLYTSEFNYKNVDIKHESRLMKFDFKVYPNPANNSLKIELPTIQEPFELTIYNSLGQVIYKQNDFAFVSTLVDLTDWKSGVYFVEIKNQNNRLSEVKKVVVLK